MIRVRALCTLVLLVVTVPSTAAPAITPRGAGPAASPPASTPLPIIDAKELAKLSESNLQAQLREAESSLEVLDTAILRVQDELADVQRLGVHKPDDDSATVLLMWFAAAKQVRDAQDISSLDESAFTTLRDRTADLRSRMSSYYPPFERVADAYDRDDLLQRKAAAAVGAVLQPANMTGPPTHERTLTESELAFPQIIKNLHDRMYMIQRPGADGRTPLTERQGLQEFLRNATLADDLPTSVLPVMRKLFEAGVKFTLDAYADYAERLRAAENALKVQRDTGSVRLTALREEVARRQTANKAVLEENMMVLLIGMMIVIVLMLLILPFLKPDLGSLIVSQRTLVELAGVTFLLMTVLLLASGGKIVPETTGTLLGTLAGYILSRRANSDSKPTREISAETQAGTSPGPPNTTPSAASMGPAAASVTGPGLPTQPGGNELSS